MPSPERGLVSMTNDGLAARDPPRTRWNSDDRLIVQRSMQAASPEGPSRDLGMANTRDTGRPRRNSTHGLAKSAPAKTATRRCPAPSLQNLGRETLAALGAAARQNANTARGGHPLTETVAPFAHEAARLICPFHYRLSKLGRRLRAPMVHKRGAGRLPSKPEGATGSNLTLSAALIGGPCAGVNNAA